MTAALSGQRGERLIFARNTRRTMRPAAAARPDGQTVRDLDNLRVLVVEDHAELARMFATLLRSQGCNVTIAEKGTTAVVLGSLFQPEVVLLDIRLPDIDGYEVARQL